MYTVAAAVHMTFLPQSSILWLLQTNSRHIECSISVPGLAQGPGLPRLALVRVLGTQKRRTTITSLSTWTIPIPIHTTMLCSHRHNCRVCTTLMWQDEEDYHPLTINNHTNNRINNNINNLDPRLFLVNLRCLFLLIKGVSTVEVVVRTVEVGLDTTGTWQRAEVTWIRCRWTWDPWAIATHNYWNNNNSNNHHHHHHHHDRVFHPTKHVTSTDKHHPHPHQSACPPPLRVDFLHDYLDNLPTLPTLPHLTHPTRACSLLFLHHYLVVSRRENYCDHCDAVAMLLCFRISVVVRKIHSMRLSDVWGNRQL